MRWYGQLVYGYDPQFAPDGKEETMQFRVTYVAQEYRTAVIEATDEEDAAVEIDRLHREGTISYDRGNDTEDDIDIVVIEEI